MSDFHYDGLVRELPVLQGVSHSIGTLGRDCFPHIFFMTSSIQGVCGKATIDHDTISGIHDRFWTDCEWLGQ